MMLDGDPKHRDAGMARSFARGVCLLKSLQMLFEYCLPRLCVSKQRSPSSRRLYVRTGQCLVPRDMYASLSVLTAHQSGSVLPAACLAQSRCALVLKLLVVDVAGVGAGHVESVPVMPCSAVRSGTISTTAVPVKISGCISRKSFQPYQKTLPMANPRPAIVVSLRRYSTQASLAAAGGGPLL